MFKPFPIYTAANKYASIYGVTTEGIRKQNRTKRMKKRTYGVQFFRAYLPTCLHDEINSFRLSTEAKSGLQIKEKKIT